jgi:hypothetical protein
MTFIRVHPPLLRQSAHELAERAEQLRRLGDRVW